MQSHFFMEMVEVQTPHQCSCLSALVQFSNALFDFNGIFDRYTSIQHKAHEWDKVVQTSARKSCNTETAHIQSTQM